MGWDVVAIGTNHNLPINDPFATARRLATIITGTLSVGYYTEFEYNALRRRVSRPSDCFKWHELQLFDTEKVGPQYLFEIINGSAKQIFERVQSFDNLSFENEKVEERFRDAILEEPFALYEISCEASSFEPRVFKEIIDFSVSFNYGRWAQFEDIFKKPYTGENKRILDEFRADIYAQLSACGCDCAYYFPDQGYGEQLFDKINLSAEQWAAYLESRSYLDNDDPNLIFFSMRDYIDEKVILKQQQSAICIIDNFS